jgi:hypothetical protein
MVLDSSLPRSQKPVSGPYPVHVGTTYEGVSKSFRTGRLERELQMVQLSATSAVVSLCCFLTSV